MSGVPPETPRRAAASSPRALEARLAQTQRWLALALGSCMAFALLALWFALSGDWRGNSVARAGFDDPDLRREAIEQMMQIGDGYFDSHPDPDVPRLLQPGIEGREFYGDLVLSTNSLGLREREFEVPKPADVTRIVLLGDSFVFGSGLNAEERFGRSLEKILRERAAATGAWLPEKIEVLHVGVSSWNIQAECAFLRRRITSFRPDLVLHVLVNNDLDDCAGIRGFGGISRFSPQQPGYADGMLRRRYAKQELGVRHVGWLSHGLDGESQTRFEHAAEEITRLKDSVQAAGGEYQMVLAWGRLNPIAHQFFSRRFEPETRIYVDPAFGGVLENRVSADDGHWSEIGGRKIAAMLYEVIRNRNLLANFDLPLWPEAITEWQRIHESGMAMAAKGYDYEGLLRTRPIASEVVFDRDLLRSEPDCVAQIHGGIDALGYVAPYGSIILRRVGDRFELEGRALARPELAGGSIAVFLDEFQVGTIELERGAFGHEIAVSIPAELMDREFVSLRLQATDWVHQGRDGRDCRSFKLDRIAFVDSGSERDETTQAGD